MRRSNDMFLGATVLVTGASAGIGRELARLLAPRAATLILVARREGRLRALADELTAQHAKLSVDVRPCDLADTAQLANMAESILSDHGHVDVLINNAGLGDATFFSSAEWRKLSLILRVNIEALTYLTHRLLPDMVARDRGGVLNISSGFGLVAMPVMATYAGSKHFVTGFTESLRAELAHSNVTISQACPGPVKTEFEGIAGNPAGSAIPNLMQLSAPRCAELCLEGFERNQAMIFPGLLTRSALWIARATPRVVLRRAAQLLARALEARGMAR